MKGSRVDRCFACGSAKFGSELHRASYRYLICSDCGSGLLPGGSEEATYEAGYFTAGKSHGYFDYAGDRRLHRETAGRRLDALLSVVPGTRTIVDVGAALGFTLEVAKERGLEAIGVERSRYATEQLTGRGFTVHQNLGALEPASTDAVIFGQVLEHMPEPGLALRQAFAAIRPGGGLFIETWDFASSTAQRFGARWQQVAPPSVIHLFTRDGLVRMLETAGFTDVGIDMWQKRVSVNGALGVMAAKLPAGLGGAVMKVARATRITRIALTYRFDDLIAVTARKPG